MRKLILGSVLVAGLPVQALAGSGHALHQDGAVRSELNRELDPNFDILAAHVHANGRIVTFHMSVAGEAGETRPEGVGQMAGSTILSYVWPTRLDPTAVGFEGGDGILALVATSHPDFDDTPLFDEDGDGDVANDGETWHSHWVVLRPNAACGDGALSVQDIPAGTSPSMPVTWPGVPIYIDSPGYSPLRNGGEITINVAFSDAVDVEGLAYDGVTSALRINQNVHAPLACVVDILDVASGDLSLPGRLGN